MAIAIPDRFASFQLQASDVPLKTKLLVGLLLLLTLIIKTIATIKYSRIPIIIPLYPSS